MISPVSQVSWFGAALFTLELAALFYHGWNSLGSQLLTRACQGRGGVQRESIFLADFEKRRLSLFSRQSNTFEQCSSSEPSVKFLLFLDEVKACDLDFNL